MERATVLKAHLLVFLTISLGLLTACEGTPPSHIKDVNWSDWIEIPQRISFSDKRGLLGIVWMTGLEPGTYRAVKEDEKGVYYKGNGFTFWTFREDMPKNISVDEGGIWIPKDPKDSLRLYVYLEHRRDISDLDELPALNLEVSQSIAAADHTGALTQLSAQTSSNAVARGVPAGTAAVGSAIGYGIVGAVIEAEAGNMMFATTPDDQSFIQKIKQGLHISR